MIKTIADLHTHTMVSQHAYSTLDEMASAARELGFSAIGITDHGPGMLDGAIAHHFFCMNGLPSEIGGLRLVKGAEVNIKDFHGRLDLENSLLSRLDFVIASYHIEAIDPASVKDHTEGWLAVIENPDVDCLAHCGNPVFSCDLPAVVKACAQHGKILEINSNSFQVRPGSDENCRMAARLCMEYEVPVIVSSDAHSRYCVGDHKAALQMLNSIGFPEELVLNADTNRLFQYLDGLKRAQK